MVSSILVFDVFREEYSHQGCLMEDNIIATVVHDRLEYVTQQTRSMDAVATQCSRNVPHIPRNVRCQDRVDQFYDEVDLVERRLGDATWCP